MRATEGYVDTDKRFLVLASGVEKPDTDCEMTADGARWSIYRCRSDPATSYYELYAHFLSDA
jgi:hypothetical protein